ncbi:MAG: hypothetical protein LUG83_01025 [Lachnospiraceae bacterium]|nr:hypothetical protein [Lachnospiraceae bacterium]
MDSKLKHGIVAVFIANMINVFFSLCTNFLLPKFLSVDSYAQIKTYQLYVSYVGLLHFGFVDGVYLRYGGKDIHALKQDKLHSSLMTMRVFQIAIVALSVVIGVVIKDPIFVFFSLSILPLNMNNYFKFLYQATGEFKRYGNAMNVTTIAIFLINMILLFAVSTDYYAAYLTGYVIVYAIIWIYLEYSFRRGFGSTKSRFSFPELVTNIKDGFLLTLGNLASIFLTSMDRWFVKILMDTVAFAQYSFAVSVENFLNLAITPITTTLYNYFCRESDPKKQNNVIQSVIAFAVLLPSAAFGVKFILEIFLTEYIDSCTVVFFLFSAQMFGIIIKGIYVNLYKVERKQKRYFVKLCSVIAIGFVTNTLFYYMWGVKEAFALATLVSTFIWFVISNFDFKKLGITAFTGVFLILQVVVLILCGLFLPAILGFIVYIAYTVIMLFVFMRSTVLSLLRVARAQLSKLKQ